MKTLHLAIASVDPHLGANLVAKIQAATRGVRLTENGHFLLRGGLGDDWRGHYRQFAHKLFPQAWIHAGGHHLAVHAAPPDEPRRINRHQVDPGGEAGRILFRIVETKPTTAEPTPKPQPSTESEPNDAVIK